MIQELQAECDDLKKEKDEEIKELNDKVKKLNQQLIDQEKLLKTDVSCGNLNTQLNCQYLDDYTINKDRV